MKPKTLDIFDDFACFEFTNFSFVFPFLSFSRFFVDLFSHLFNDCFSSSYLCICPVFLFSFFQSSELTPKPEKSRKIPRVNKNDTFLSGNLIF